MTGPRLKLPAIDVGQVAVKSGSTVYPEGLREICDGREKQALGDAAGLSQFGVNRVTLAPGAASAHRHWHTSEDEFIFVISGELMLISDAGEQALKMGDAAGFPANSPDGHQVVNKGSLPATYLEIGTRTKNDEVHYPDVDLHLKCIDGQYNFSRKNGEPC